MPIIAYLPYSDNTTFFDIFPNSSYLLLFTGWGEVPEGTPCSKAEHPVLYSFKAGRYQLWKKGFPDCVCRMPRNSQAGEAFFQSVPFGTPSREK
jgi:hypothetical protein